MLYGELMPTRSPHSMHLPRPVSVLVRTLLALVLSGILWFTPRPAVACACGALVDNTDSHVTGETSLLTWNSGHETITMMMKMASSAPDAAWIMPAPEGTDVTLGSDTPFTALATDSQPRVEHVKDWTPTLSGLDRIGHNGARAGDSENSAGVEVESTTVLGPYQVVTLSGNDASAVNDWLIDNGYPDRSDLITPFQGYLDQGWRILAVKLVPQNPDEEFDGTLPPMNLSFDAPEPVYPIRLSSMATRIQELRLYVVADHKLDISRQAAPDEPLDLFFSGRVKASDAGLDTGFDGSDEVWLTTYDGYLDSSSITDDYTFAQASSDEGYQRVTIETDDRPGQILGLGLFLFSILAVPAVLAGVVVRVVTRQRRAPARR